MPGAERTTKKLAQRIDLNYFKRPSSFRRWRFWLSLGVPILAVVWLAWYGLTGSKRVYSGGKMSAAHAVLAAKCDACHFEAAGFFSAKASDRACLGCHDGPIHHANQTFTPRCASCHEEHRGNARLAATSDASCTQCHADLRTAGATTKFARNVESFGPGHPEFAVLRSGMPDPGTIKLNHAVHMKRNLAGPNGPVQLDCDDCHRPPTSADAWRFGTATPASPIPVAQSAAMPPSQKSDLAAMVLARAYMAPPTYAKTCVACHGLQFDKRFTESVPHDTPEVVHKFLVQRFQQYIAAHPAEVRVTEAVPGLPQKPQPVAVRVLTPQQWVTERVAESEQLLWGKTCRQCHAMNFSAGGGLPTVAKSNITPRWLPHANFNHDRHQMVKCSECHAAALTSQETSDILVPGIRTCERCHHAGADAAESRCFECHTYHDWTKAKPVKGRLTLSGLFRGD
ncbi:MAG TPA: hypothetical protein VJO53_00460 [Candidatus Acidoferrales bacterium]|nr:hypothetical protein [Candidatus Acidoferrales bacterium]